MTRAMPVPAKPRRRLIALALLGASLMASTGCVRFGSKPPAQLLAISAQVADPATLSAPAGAAMFVGLPVSPRAIANTRVAVRDSATSFAYIKDALWADTPARQFQAVLAETIRGRTGRLVLDPGQFLARRGQTLEGTLQDFGIDAPGHKAVVTYDATLLSADGATITRRRFTATAPIAQIDARSVGPAINQAANEVAVAVADWLQTRGQ